MSGHLDAEGLSQAVTHHQASGLDIIAAPTDPSLADRVSAQIVTEPAARRSGELRVRHRRHPSVVHRARPRGLRRQQPPRPHRHARHPGGQEPSARPRDARRAGQPEGLARHRPQPCRRQGRPQPRRRGPGPRCAHRGECAREQHRARVREPGVPLVLESPKDPVSGALREIVDTHIRARFGAPVEEPQRRSLFSRRSR